MIALESVKTKICIDCRQTLPIAGFYFSHGYYVNPCKKCRIVRVRKWNLANPEQTKATKRRSYENNRPSTYLSNRRWIAKNPERYKVWKQEWLANNRGKTRGFNNFTSYRIKQEVLDRYGRTCSHCGHADEDVLVVDHVNNDGSAERQQVRSNYTFYKLVRDTQTPERYQILCCNCNWKKHVNGGKL